jgi:hypothetical protein
MENKLAEKEYAEVRGQVERQGRGRVLVEVLVEVWDQVEELTNGK